MKFQLYLKEGRSKLLEFDEVLKMAPQYKDSLKAYLFSRGHGVLMRGVNRAGKNFDYDNTSALDYGDWMHVSPANFSRKANYARNQFYFAMFDTLPSWSEYPRRTMSVVGATQNGKAGQYDGMGVYMMFPENGSKIAVASGPDLWASFSSVFKTSSEDEVLGLFGDNMIMMMSELVGKEYKVNTPAEFKKLCKDFDTVFKGLHDGDKKKLMQWVNAEDIELVDEFIKGYYNGNMAEALNTAFSPVKNKIKLIDAGSTLPMDKEWWTDAPCLMLRSGHEHSDEGHEELAQLAKVVGAPYERGSESEE